MNPAGIYLHIPFCKRICYYCDFYRRRDLRLKDAFLQALEHEVHVRAPHWKEERFTTIYFGGGTPSLLKKEELQHLLDLLHSFFHIEEKAEVTLEANPEDLNREYLKELLRIGFNRLSVGVQSFQDDLLRLMNRRHDAAKAEKVLREAADAGFKNITADLIYGIPGLEPEMWEEDLRKMFGLPVQHLSAYLLTFEERTVFGKWLEQGRIMRPQEETVLQQYRLLRKLSEEHGFVHYEISNLGREGFFSQHNLLYWQGGKYLGLGPSAHSYDGSTRRWNLADLEGYLKAKERGEEPPYEKERADERIRFNDLLLTRLRTMWGIDMAAAEEQWPAVITEPARRTLEKWIKTGHVERKGTVYRLTGEGMFLSDTIISECMAV